MQRAFPVAAAAILTLLVGCSESDSTNQPETPADQTPPFVVSVDPSTDRTGVEVDEEITVVFSEAMDPASATGQITLSSGTVGTMTWSDDRTLVVAHSSWGEGVEVDVTVGSGMTDVAGNALAATFDVRFWTESSQARLLSSEPENGATNVIRNGQVYLLFSREMDISSLSTATSVSAEPTLRAPVTFTLEDGEGDWVVMSFDDTLPSESTVEIFITTDAQSTDGTGLEAEASFIFSTGFDTDDTPPSLVSTEPANGAIVGQDTGYLRFTFDEPIDAGEFSPSFMSGQFMLLMDRAATDPAWSDNGRVVTVALPTDLPPGSPIVLHFDGYRDRAGNVQTNPIEYEITVAGTADGYPLRDGEGFTLRGIEVDGDGSGPLDEREYTDWERIELEAANEYRRVRYTDDSFSVTDGWDYLRRSTDQIAFTGFHEIDGPSGFDVLFTDPVIYARRPFAIQSWSGTSQADTPDGPMDIAYSVSVTAQENVPAFLESFERGGSAFTRGLNAIEWVDCWVSTLSYELSAGGETITEGSDQIWFAPTVGIVKVVSHEESPDGEWRDQEASLVEIFTP